MRFGIIICYFIISMNEKLAFQIICQILTTFDICLNSYTEIFENDSLTSHFHLPFQLSKLFSCRDRRKDTKLLNLNLLSLFLEDWIDRVVTTQSILYHYSEKIHLWIFSQCLQDRRPKMIRLKLFISCSRGKALIIIPSETRPS